MPLSQRVQLPAEARAGAAVQRHPIGSSGVIAGERWIKWSALFIVFAATSFNFLLCFVNTNLTQVTAVHVIGSEMIIISAAFLVSLRSIGPRQVVLLSGMLLYLTTLALVRVAVSPGEPFDVKIIRDFLIPVAFFLLGTRTRDARSADFVAFCIAVVVTLIALFEYFFLDIYLQYFNVIRYYLARGSVESAQTEFLSTNLFVSGFRPEGRNLLPFLGDHRVSSLFLEPVSPGNFGVILFFWALVRSRFEKKLYAALFAMALFLIVMADNRFGAMLCFIALGLASLPIRYSHPVVLCLPMVFVSGLAAIVYAFKDVVPDNSFVGRLIVSNDILSSLSFWNWMGLQVSPVPTADSGYSYVLTGIGIFGSASFWWIFMTLKSQSRQLASFRVFTGLYLSSILCVSYSPFTIKTAALLWFLLGVLAYTAEYPAGRQRTSRALAAA
jgi:putative polymerase